ncbi:MAG TPA: YggT family protein [Candidatus Nanoarchaeia archaeon]|nr:YggT family protein [Candidatus Nanoarchaeia archaeon]
MEKVVKETVVRAQGAEVNQTDTTPEASPFQTVQYLIYFFFGALDILLVFRLVLKLLGASLSSGFVTFIYNLSGVFIAPFEGIFRTATSQGLETTSVLEPATVVAIIVYAVLAWGIVELIKVLSGKQQES